MSKENFKRYSSIENIDKEKTILHFLSYFPELADEKYIAYEKLDGANIQLLFDKDVDGFRVGKRSAFLDKDDTFFDIWDTLDKYKLNLEVIEDDFKRGPMQKMRLYGELYGPGINGRVNYGPSKRIAFFDLYYVDGEVDKDGELIEKLMCQRDFKALMKSWNVTDMMPPLKGMYKSLDEALAIDVEFESKVFEVSKSPQNPVLTNFAEGVVIQPYNKVYRIPGRSHFIMKKKSKRFKDKEDKGGANKKPKEALPEGTSKLCREFLSYINDNRIIDVFSKHGNIEEDKQIGEYIRYVLEDAKEDFWKDNPELILTDKQTKVVFNTGKQIVRLLYTHL